MIKKLYPAFGDGVEVYETLGHQSLEQIFRHRHMSTGLSVEDSQGKSEGINSLGTQGHRAGTRR